MKNSFDAIIIGSGLGGLTSAATLAKNGFKVAVFERHSQPGGYATTFYRDDFEFEVSLHAMSGVGTPENPGPLRSFYQALGILDRVRFLPMEDLYRTIGDGVDITIPKSPQLAIKTLTEAFPHEAEGIKRFIEQIMTVGEEVQLIREGGYGTAPLSTLARFPSLAHAAGTTVADVMDPLISDATVKLVLGQLWGYFGLPPSKLSFLLFAAGVSSYLRWGSVTIEGKSQSLSNAYVDIIQQNGGEVYLAEGVREIIVENSRVAGVTSDKGVRYSAATVISNADPYTTLHRLLAEEHVAPKYKRRLEAAEPSAATVTLYLGLNRPSKAVGIENHELYINLDTDMDIQWDKCGDLLVPGVVSVCAYDNSNAGFAPVGKGVLAITILQNGEPWTLMDDARYAVEKERFTDMLLRIVEQHFPLVRDAVETSVLSTPLTNIRYTGNPHGAIYGFASTPEENPGFRMENRGPVDGLWFAGAWTRPSAGYQGVITSGYNTATDIMTEWGHTNLLPYGVGASSGTLEPSLHRRVKGWKLMLRDGKRVGKVIRSKYRKYDNAPLGSDFVSIAESSTRHRAVSLSMRVVSRVVETPDTVTLRLIPNGSEHISFAAGQYVDISATIRGERVTRAYSISSAPTAAGYLDITVKAQAHGKMSRHLVHDTRLGDELSVVGSYGGFTYVPQRDLDEVLAVAVGSGITPLMSMIRAFDGQFDAPAFHLIYGARKEEDIIFRNELDDIMFRNPKMKVTYVLSRPSRFWTGRRGRISSETLFNIVGNALKHTSVFICGPASLYKPLVHELKTAGVADAHIRFESFQTGPSTREPLFEMSVGFIRCAVPAGSTNCQTWSLCHLVDNPALLPAYVRTYC